MTTPQIGHDRYFQFWRNLIDAELQDLLPDRSEPTQLVNSAMNYAVSCGHRWRPMILIAAYELGTGRKGLDVLDAACAVELVHSCTIIVDDLPCVDSAGFRRGRPTCHKIYGEAATLYASHLLYAKAERLAYETAKRLGIDGEAVWYYLAETRERLVDAQVQEINLNQGAVKATLDSLERLYELKSYPFILAGWLGSVLGNLELERRQALVSYSKYLGMAYQVIDDIQDAEGDPSKMGKAVGMDNGRVNVVRWAGVREARSTATDYVRKAERALNGFSEEPSLLRNLMYRAVGISRAGSRFQSVNDRKHLAHAS